MTAASGFSAHVGKGLRLCLLMASLAGLAGCEAELYSGLDEREGNLMLAELLDAGIMATKSVRKDGKLIINVEEGDFAQAVRILDLAGLPKEKFTTLGEVFKSESLVASPMQERARMLFAMSEELSRTISEIDGVLSARVHIVLPDNDPLRGQISPSSASVFMRHDSSVDIGTLIPQIKTLVSNGVAGLSYDKISVVPVVSQQMEHKSQDAVRMASFLGTSMPEASLGRIKLVVGALAGLCMVLVALLAYVMLSVRSRTFALAPLRKD